MGLRPDIANPNPRTKPSWDTKSAAAVDTLRITTCGICHHGVYKGQAYAWSDGGDAPVGINHEGCAQHGGGSA